MGQVGGTELAVSLATLLVYGVVVCVPVAVVFRRVGWSPWLCILAIVPVANVVLLWVFAFARWGTPPATGRIV